MYANRARVRAACLVTNPARSRQVLSDTYVCAPKTVRDAYRGPSEGRSRVEESADSQHFGAAASSECKVEGSLLQLPILLLRTYSEGSRTEHLGVTDIPTSRTADRRRHYGTSLV